MRAVAGTRALNRDGNADRSAGIGERDDVFFPRTLVEIDCDKPTGLVFEEGIGTEHVSSLQMVDNDLVAEGHEGLIYAVTASAAGPEQAQRRFPFVGATLQTAGFPIDPADAAQVRSRDDNRFTSYQLAYAIRNGAQETLRPTIQIELNYAALRRTSVVLPVASFIAEAFGRSPEIPAIACMGVAETAAEKFVSLTI